VAGCGTGGVEQRQGKRMSGAEGEINTIDDVSTIMKGDEV
jgi:hypothetical protein